ncbi:MAG: creatininase family protein [Anaerolineae bacterium]|nr:creatininase family protein [Anaerolineae bacterium]
MSPKIVYKEMTWLEIQERLKTCNICIIPLGAMEQHGNHLPVGTDTFQSYEMARRGAERAADEVGAVLLPGIEYGSTTSTRFFPGTVNISPRTLSRYLVALMEGLYRQGFRRFVLVNGHGGNSYPRQASAQMVSAHNDAEVFYTGTFGLGLWNAVSADPENVMVGHACEIETSLMLEIYGSAVEMDKVTDGELFGEFLSKYSFVLDPNYGVGTLQNRWQTMTIGARGRPFRGTQPYGQRLIANWVDRFAEMLREMQSQA